jgi:hypothetical protein
MSKRDHAAESVSRFFRAFLEPGLSVLPGLAMSLSSPAYLSIKNRFEIFGWVPAGAGAFCQDFPGTKQVEWFLGKHIREGHIIYEG